VDFNYGPITVDIPRDRFGTFLPPMVPKGLKCLTDVDVMLVSLYAGGMTIRDIQHHMATAMRGDISHETISAVTDAVVDGCRVVNKSAYMAIGVDLDGIKHILGLWIAKRRRRFILGAGVF